MTQLDWIVMVSLLALLAVVAGCASPGGQAGRAARGRYADVDGLKMYYEIHGEPSDAHPPLVLLHGGGSTIETSFGSLLPMLAKHRQVIAFEQQGHGRTADILDRPFSFEQSADDAAELLRQLKIDRADFFGFSNGGSIAMQVAVRHPKLVRKLIVASAMYRRDAFDPGFWEGMRQATLQSMPQELRDAYVKVAPHPEQLQSFHDKSVKRMLAFKDWPPEMIRSIGAPTLILIGDADVIRPEHAVEMYRLLPHGHLAVLPCSDHSVLVERPDWAAPMVETFLNEPLPKAE